MLKPMDWIWVISMIVGSAVGLLAYAHTNFISKDEKLDLKESIQLVQHTVERLDDKVDRTNEKLDGYFKKR